MIDPARVEILPPRVPEPQDDDGDDGDECPACGTLVERGEVMCCWCGEALA